MEEMTLDEAREIIGNLVNCLEECVVLSAAYKIVFSVHGKPGWEDDVEYAQAKIYGAVGEVFLPLREMLRGSSAVQRSEIDWHQIVLTLIESAKDSGPL